MFILTTSLGISAIPNPVMMLLQLTHSSKNSLKDTGLSIADTRTGHTVVVSEVAVTVYSWA